MTRKKDAGAGAKTREADDQVGDTDAVDLATSVADLATLPPELRATAVLVVKSKGDQRRRAGRSFTREETVIPLRDLSDAEISAIEGDPALIVYVRVTAPKR